MEIKTIETSGWGGAFHSMRNPMNSWLKNDSYYDDDRNFVIGPNDMKLIKTLISSGPEHAKVLRMIQVQADFIMPRAWWGEFDTYHFNTKSSQSTMHKLLNNNEPITSKLFASCKADEDVLHVVIDRLEYLRKTFKDIQHEYDGEDKNEILNELLVRAKRLLPEGFLQMRTVSTNYAELRTIYHQRKNHRLKEEWQDTFCEWVKTLPYAKELIID